MTDLAVLDARYCGRLRIPQNRPVVLIEFEVDIVHLQRILDVLGQPPKGIEIPVAIARLDERATAGGADAAAQPASPPPVDPNTEKAGSAQAIPSYGTPPPAASPLPAPKPARPHEKWEQMRPSKQAALRCADPRFRKWLFGQGARMDSDTGADAAEALRRAFDIKSRADLDVDSAAAARWRAMDARFLAALTTAERREQLERYG